MAVIQGDLYTAKDAMRIEKHNIVNDKCKICGACSYHVTQCDDCNVCLGLHGCQCNDIKYDCGEALFMVVIEEE